MTSSFQIIGTVSKAGTLSELLNAPDKLEYCDIVELRFDEFMDRQECLSLCKKLRQYTKVLLTIRTNREGGTWDINDDDRFELFNFFASDVDYFDIELKSQLFKDYSKSDFNESVKIIASYHDYISTPDKDSIQHLINSGKNWGADIVKLAVTPKTQDELLLLESFLDQANLCLIGMGDIGVVSRSEFPTKGSVLTYGYLDDSAAPGQLSAKQLHDLLRS
jgi:3-dehydroquinate dehydratase-1